MAEYRGFVEAHKRAERIITANLRRAWKPLRESAIKEIISGDFSPYDLDILANVIFKGLITAYIYGRIYGYSFTQKLIKRHKSKLEITLAEAPTIEEIVSWIYDKDKNLLKLILGVETFKKITKDVFKEYFSPSEHVINFLNSYAVSLSNVEDIATRKEVSEVVKQTLKDGLSEREAIKVASKKLQQFTERRIQMIARTEATRSFNIGNLYETYSSDVIQGYRYVAVLDDRTTKHICRPRHGKFISKDNIALLATNTPPLHVNCRSFLEPVSTFRKPPKALDPDVVEPGMQRSEDIALIQGILADAGS